MFENVLGQPAADQIREDMESGRLAPSMLFFGPPGSGKGTAGLELARALSCENSPAGLSGEKPGRPMAPWNCTCSACASHRMLSHPDLLILGPRSFSPEIAASQAAFSREPKNPAAAILFIRALRKLLARFSPILLEDDPKLGKLGPLIVSLEEDISELELLLRDEKPAFEKICAAMLKNAFKLEDEGLGDIIPIGRIRRAAYWSRLAPSGRRKILLIENADRMQEGARNSLLKILEEPPATLTILLTAPRREAILPTLLSRLRPYRFLRRDLSVEAEVIRRVFRDSPPEPDRPAALAGGLIGAYLDSFLPLPGEKLYPLAAFFIAALARAAALALRKRGVSVLPEELVLLGKNAAPLAEAAGFGRSGDSRETVALLLAETGNFEARSFPRFLGAALSLVSGALREGNAKPGFITYIEIWRKCAGEAEAAAGTWNQTPALALERLFFRLKDAMVSAASAGGSVSRMEAI
jgi:DNA polymerase-3 subunit gamma/tau